MRATKYTDETRAKLLAYVEQGRTVKDACKAASISDMTLTRWRRSFPEFDEAYLTALEHQWHNLENLKEIGVRTYRRNAEKARVKAEQQAEAQKMEQEKERAKEDGRTLVYEGLRVRYGDIEEDEPFIPCINPSSMQVEYLRRQDGRYVRFALSVDVFKRKYPAYYRELAEQNSVYNVGD